MDFNEFEQLAKQYNLIPVYEKITADLLTPVLAYLKIREPNVQSFLLESVEGVESFGRYSFIGKKPEKIIFNFGQRLHIGEKDKFTIYSENIFDYIRREISGVNAARIDDLPFFTSGIVGYFGYENISLIENVIKFDSDNEDNPDSIFGVYNTFLAFDHYKHQIILITNVHITPETDLPSAYSKAKKILSDLRKELSKPVTYKSNFSLTSEVSENISDEEFHQQVLGCKQNILEGDIFQIVLSKRFSAGYEGDLLNVYRALRIINPSPYMYFLEFNDGLSILGTSPENLVKVKNGTVETMPIAGTRKRGKNIIEDNEMENDLLNDPKELAEHVMLLDLGRNDLGRVCEYNTINIPQQMTVHKYSHVMHLVSRVEGKLAENKDCIDAFCSCFPAGTVTGAPKIRAIQLINKYENIKRNIYAGSIGYIDLSGNLDMCITIRTLFAKNNIVSWQAGAGIVADSIPELESKEIKNKSRVMFNALKYAGGIDEDISD
jgi:anthranilate synthase component 1